MKKVIALLIAALCLGIGIATAGSAQAKALGVKWTAPQASVQQADVTAKADIQRRAVVEKTVVVPGRNLVLGIEWRAISGCGGTCYNAQHADAANTRGGGGFQNGTFRYGNNNNSNCSNLGVVGNGAQDLISVNFPQVCVFSGAVKPYVNIQTQREFSDGIAYDIWTYYLCGKLVNAQTGQIVIAGSGC